MKGKFITIEGIDTSGKSTQVELLVQKLKMDGYDVMKIHFPDYEGEIGQVISEVLKGKKIDSKSLQLLFVADQLSRGKEISEHIEKGGVVVCDRYDLSTAIYSEATFSGFNYIYNHVQRYLIRPDITAIIDLDGNKVSSRKEKLDDNEKNLELMIRTSELYKKASCYIEDDRKIFYVDGENTLSEIENLIYKKIKEFLREDK